jgi:hypothetical protein
VTVRALVIGVLFVVACSATPPGPTVKSNPLSDITVLENVAVVVERGAVFRAPATLIAERD